MTLYIAIALGGSLGAVCRYWISSSTYAMFGAQFPFGTLAVNVSGSLVMGFLAIFLSEKWIAGEALRMALLVGFLGSYTTFSTFALDAMHWLNQGEWVKVVVYITSSVFGSLLGVYIGYLGARALLR